MTNDRYILVDVATDPEATVAVIEMDMGGYELRATGAAKKHPKDFHDPELARVLAVSRAMANMAKVLETEANVRIENNDKARQAVRAFSTGGIVTRNTIRANTITEIPF